jgi:hypothetical protein
MKQELAAMKFGALLALLTLLLGFGLGALFGLAEDWVKDGFLETAKQTLAKSATDLDKEAGALTGRAWTYMKRAHLHANGLGTSALSMILLMTFLPAGDTLKKVTSLLLGIGALGYSTFWLLAAQRTPALGSTGAAKESLRWLAMPTSAFLILGLLLVIWMLVSGLKSKS